MENGEINSSEYLLFPSYFPSPRLGTRKQEIHIAPVTPVIIIEKDDDLLNIAPPLRFENPYICAMWLFPDPRFHNNTPATGFIRTFIYENAIITEDLNILLNGPLRHTCFNRHSFRRHRRNRYNPIYNFRSCPTDILQRSIAYTELFSELLPITPNFLPFTRFIYKI